jgi:hypothetical protein
LLVVNIARYFLLSDLDSGTLPEAEGTCRKAFIEHERNDVNPGIRKKRKASLRDAVRRLSAGKKRSRKVTFRRTASRGMREEQV